MREVLEETLKKIRSETQRDIVILYTNLSTDTNSEINIGEYKYLREHLYTTENDKPGMEEILLADRKWLVRPGVSQNGCDVIVHSQGGELPDFISIVRILRRVYKELNIIIPEIALSAASLVGFGGCKLYFGRMAKVSEFTNLAGMDHVPTATKISALTSCSEVLSQGKVVPKSWCSKFVEQMAIISKDHGHHAQIRIAELVHALDTVGIKLNASPVSDIDTHEPEYTTANVHKNLQDLHDLLRKGISESNAKKVFCILNGTFDLRITE